ncbi:MAG: mechanosensitive ion channel family protein [Candidatus Thermoplasmatota archaeon]|nr:mechanosensitive ion channel family protein [Candidatus Thermoplasmatota archaeon]
MSGRFGRRSCLISLISVLLLLAAVAPSSGQTIDEPIEVEDLQSLLDMYNPDIGRFGTIGTGSFVSFQDEVSYIGTLTESMEEEGMEVSVEKSYMILRSNEERSDELYILKFHDTELREKIKIGAKVSITVRISEQTVDNRSVQYIRTQSEVELVKQGKDDVVKETDIEIFGISIPVSFLPKEYRTPLVRFLIVFAIWALAAFLIWLLFMVVVKISRRTKTEVDQQILGIITGPFFVVIILYGLIISLSQFDLNPRFLDILDKVYRAVTIILIAYIAVKVFKKVIMSYLKMVSKKTETQADDVLVPVLGKLATVVIWIVAIVLFLRVFGIDITVFIMGMGIAGLVIALAAQDTMSNFFAGLMILLDRPFKEGDWIDMDGSTYQVRHIGLRSTRLFHTMSNQIVTMPNNRISDHMFSNLSEPDFFGRKTVKVGVSYKQDPSKVGALLLEIVNTHPDTLVDKDHQPLYRFSAFGDSSLNFEVNFWVRDFNDQWRVASEIRERIYERFEKEGIEIPFPQRVVHMTQKSGPEEKPVKEPPQIGDMQNLSV